MTDIDMMSFPRDPPFRFFSEAFSFESTFETAVPGYFKFSSSLFGCSAYTVNFT